MDVGESELSMVKSNDFQIKSRNSEIVAVFLNKNQFFENIHFLVISMFMLGEKN